MQNKKNIAIIAGGDSSESIISLKSAESLIGFIPESKYNRYLVIIKKNQWHVQMESGQTEEINKNDFSFRNKSNNEITRFDFAYITIHGTPGEDGRLQGYFDLIGLPYSSCSVLSSALTFNKFTCNNYLKSLGIPVADSLRLFPGETIDNNTVVERLGLPVFIKPNDGGSSFGTSKVKTIEEIQPAIRKAFDEGKEVIIEKFMPGTELTCGCFKTGGKLTVLPVTEVISKNDFFDFEAKYTAEKVEEITPARISNVATQEVQGMTSRIYEWIAAKGIIRVDYILSAEGKVRMLEVNTTPGMTSTSFIPQQVKASGLDIRNVMEAIIEDELKKEYKQNI